MPPTYRERLRIEGAALAGCGAVGSVALLALAPQAKRWPLNTIGQLAVVAGLLGYFGPRSARRAMQRSEARGPGAIGSGEPTPLWHIPPIVAGLSLAVTPSPGGWDASLRVTAGCVLVGAAQALLLERTVALEERRSGRTFFRLAGSRLGRGTKLGYPSSVTTTPAPA